MNSIALGSCAADGIIEHHAKFPGTMAQHATLSTLAATSPEHHDLNTTELMRALQVLEGGAETMQAMQKVGVPTRSFACAACR
jgi:hypothetical protein